MSFSVNLALSVFTKSTMSIATKDMTASIKAIQKSAYGTSIAFSGKKVSFMPSPKSEFLSIAMVGLYSL